METLIILIITSGLGITVPLLFSLLLFRNKSKSIFGRNLLIGGVLGWSVIMWVLGVDNFFAYQEGDNFPRFLFPLFFPVIVFVGLLMFSKFRMLIENLELKQLIGFQFWRIFGAVFFVIAIEKIGPPELFYSGVGDVLTGFLAFLTFVMLKKKNQLSKVFVWLFMLVGIADLLGVLFILLTNYPIWSDAIITSSSAGEFPMILVVGIVAPIALITHVLTLRKLLFSK